MLSYVWLTDHVSMQFENGLLVVASGARNREEAREAGSFARFLHALPTFLPSSFLTRLEISKVEFVSMEEFSALCSGIASPLCTLRELYCRDVTMPRGQLQAVQDVFKDALFHNTSLRELSLDTSDDHFWTPSGLVPALSRTPCSITHLCLAIPSLRMIDEVSTNILTGLAHNTITLRHLSILSYYNVSQHEYCGGGALNSMLSTNTSLLSLELEGLQLAGEVEVVQRLFASLEQNAHLISLSLMRCRGPDWPSASFVLDSLRVNGILHELDLDGTPLEGKGKAAIKAQLERNRQRVEQVAALKAEGSALVPPTTVRLFLCGLPHSGKTTLSRSLVKISTASTSANCLISCLPLTSVPERTRGIHVSTMEKDGVKVSLWDMAGQAEYYAFHDQMFPDLSNDATPSLFLFVWNPIQLHKSTSVEIADEHGRNIIKTLEMFDHEFRYWLRFIASKTLQSLKFRPKLLVAITRADLLHAQINIRSWIISTFNKCQHDFKEHIQFDMEGVFEMNARDPRQAKLLGLHIFDFAASILKSKPLVYEACNQARRVLAELVHSRPLAPLVTKAEFFRLCQKHLGLDSIQMQEAIALSLNESGDLIYFKALELVVLDTKWFCHEFMGDLLHFSNPDASHNKGFFSPQYLQDLLESKVNCSTARGSQRQLKAIRIKFAKARPSSPTIKGDDLVKLLIGMQLACLQNDGQVDSDIFIPASLCTTTSKRIDPRKYLMGDERNIKTFLGRRLKCKDSLCTFFTPGIFSVLQVAFINDLKRVGVTRDEDVIAFSKNGVKVLVEFCKHEGRDHFIDVLIHSRHNLDNTIGWAYEEVLEKMRSICALPRGIQGVQLVYEVIRPRSVEEFNGMEDRIDTAVSVVELCKTLRHALEKRGTQPDCLKSVFYDWHPTNDSDCVIDLLGNVETLKVFKEYRQKFILDVEDVLGINVEKEVCSTSEQEKRVFSSSTSGIERKWIYDRVEEVHKDIQEVHKEVKKLADDVQNLGHAILPQVLRTVQELLTFAKDGEFGKLPRMFVVTRNDVGFVRKLVGAMVPGLKNLQLEILCEHRSRPHLVAEQHGISFATLEDGLLKQGLPYINMFLKLAGLAVKVGAHVAVGLGDTIPDFSCLLAAVVDTPEFPSLPTCSDLQTSGASRLNFKESQQWLFDVLSKHNCSTSTRIHEVFGLRRVRYRDSHVGWLCEEHCSQGELCPI